MSASEKNLAGFSYHSLVTLLFFVLVAKWILHAIYLPVFEGPDEPFHLGNAVALRSAGIQGLLSPERRLPREIDEAIKTHPCSPDLARSFHCPPFSGNEAFNILEPTRPAPSGGWAPNYEAHQPPIYYMLAATFVGSERMTVESRLLICRAISLLLAFVGTLFLVRLLSRESEYAASATVLLLLLPGASESLIRCANESLVFLWCACIVWSLREHRIKRYSNDATSRHS